MGNIGTATLNFGAAPGSNEASVAVTSEAAILSGSVAEAYFMADTTTDHTPSDHSYANLFVALTCGAVVAGTGFTIYGMCADMMVGTFTVHWVWN